MVNFLDEIYLVRIEGIIERNQDRLQAEQKLDEIINLICKHVSGPVNDEVKRLADELMDAITENEKIWYQEGIKDGIRLSEEIGKANN
ncbi:hypothetical protein [Zhenhengia yiwuensis]|uniref:hypothetical protein n=1 Tax=Zhenhengia yiwuensis TaxID=2763666 RepID=UPI002A74AA19|nr:hypothetical protein [Zhenhengia yiwuensis]MDY3366489.1 hypothetical protein [Zhenhengia yiwuensis]